MIKNVVFVTLATFLFDVLLKGLFCWVEGILTRVSSNVCVLDAVIWSLYVIIVGYTRNSLRVENCFDIVNGSRCFADSNNRKRASIECLNEA